MNTYLKEIIINGVSSGTVGDTFGFSVSMDFTAPDEYLVTVGKDRYALHRADMPYEDWKPAMLRIAKIPTIGKALARRYHNWYHRAMGNPPTISAYYSMDTGADGDIYLNFPDAELLPEL